MVRGSNKKEVASLPLKYPYAITVSSPTDFKIVGREGSYAGQGHLREIRFGGLDDPLEITISKAHSEVRGQTAKTPTLTVPSHNLAFRFEEEEYKLYQDPNTKEYVSVYGEGGANRRYRLGKLDDPTSNIRQILDATPTDYAKQIEILQKLPRKFVNVGQMTKACYTVLQHLGLVERSGEHRNMLLRRTKKSLKEVE